MMRKDLSYSQVLLLVLCLLRANAFAGPDACGPTKPKLKNTNVSIPDIYNFTGGADGQYPYGGAIADSSGNLYGTAEGGGSEISKTAHDQHFGIVLI